MRTDVDLLYSLDPGGHPPERATDGSAGLDLRAPRSLWLYRGVVAVVDTLVRVAVPIGYVGLLVVRSSATSTGLRMPHSVGVIDSDYRGTIRVPLVLGAEREPAHLEQVECRQIKAGERIAQLVVVPCPVLDLCQVDELPATARGEGGFGSSGR